jgi:hypothetical protein
VSTSYARAGAEGRARIARSDSGEWLDVQATQVERIEEAHDGRPEGDLSTVLELRLAADFVTQASNVTTRETTLPGNLSHAARRSPSCEWREFSDELIEIGELLKRTSDTKPERITILTPDVSPSWVGPLDKTKSIEVQLPSLPAPGHRPATRHPWRKLILVSAFVVASLAPSSLELKQGAMRLGDYARFAGDWWRAEILRAIDP